MQTYQALRETFQDQGFLHLPGFADPKGMERIEAEITRVVTDVVPGLAKNVAMYEDYDRPESLKQVNVPPDQSPNLAELGQSEQFLGLAQALLGEEARPQSIELFIKPPLLGTPTPPHQDGYYFCLQPNHALTAWLALDDMDEENGTLHYVAGSHKKGVLPHNPSQVLGFSQGVNPEALAQAGDETPCPLRRGDLLVHHSLTIHRAAGNPSPRLRRALAFVYYGRSAKVDPAQQRRYQASVDAQQKAIGVA